MDYRTVMLKRKGKLPDCFGRLDMYNPPCMPDVKTGKLRIRCKYLDDCNEDTMKRVREWAKEEEEHEMSKVRKE